MTEHYIEAIVLDNEIVGELDGLITLYTKELGKVVAKAKSARKITSKLNGHFQPLNFINCRLIEKRGIQAVDALTFDISASRTEKFINVAQFIKDMTFDFHQDLRLWQAIKKIFSADLVNLEEKVIYRGLLKILGFDPEHAACVMCHNNQIKYFIKHDHSFLCEKCAGKSIKNDLLLI